MPRIRKTEHSGAKNGGGFWGQRAEAKALSKKARREQSKRLLKDERSNSERKMNEKKGK